MGMKSMTVAAPCSVSKSVSSTIELCRDMPASAHEALSRTKLVPSRPEAEQHSAVERRLLDRRRGLGIVCHFVISNRATMSIPRRRSVPAARPSALTRVMTPGAFSVVTELSASSGVESVTAMPILSRAIAPLSGSWAWAGTAAWREFLRLFLDGHVQRHRLAVADGNLNRLAGRKAGDDRLQFAPVLDGCRASW